MCALCAGMAMAATEVSNFNFDWKFKLGTVQGAEKVDFDDAANDVWVFARIAETEDG